MFTSSATTRTRGPAATARLRAGGALASQQQKHNENSAPAGKTVLGARGTSAASGLTQKVALGTKRGTTLKSVVTRAQARTAAAGKEPVLAAKASSTIESSEAGGVANLRGRKRAALGDVSNNRGASMQEKGPVKKTRTATVALRASQLGSGSSGKTGRRVSSRLGEQRKRLMQPIPVSQSRKRSGVRHGIEKATVRAPLQPVHTNDVAVQPKQLTSESDPKKKKQQQLAKIQPQPQQHQDWEDLDAPDSLDPLMVSEYVVEIYEYLRELEPKTMPSPNYMDEQKELDWKMRTTLIDWLILVHERFRLLPETLFLAVNIVDRFLSARTVSLVKFQLVGLTALMVAAKYEEIATPSVDNFLYIADNGYKEDELLKAERYMLQVLNFNLSYPNPLHFLRRVSKSDNYDVRSRTVGKYVMEVAMLDPNFVACPPSMLAALGIYLARKMLKLGPWDANLRHYSGYTEEDIEPWFQLMLQLLANGSSQDACYTKYANKKFLKASIATREWVKRHRAASPPSDAT